MFQEEELTGNDLNPYDRADELVYRANGLILVFNLAFYFLEHIFEELIFDGMCGCLKV